MLFLSIFIHVNKISLIEKKFIYFLQDFLVLEHHLKDRVIIHFLELDVALRTVFFEEVEAWDVVTPDDIFLDLLHTVFEDLQVLVLVCKLLGF